MADDDRGDRLPVSRSSLESPRSAPEAPGVTRAPAAAAATHATNAQ
jgi:hypothetical protein